MLAAESGKSELKEIFYEIPNLNDFADQGVVVCIVEGYLGLLNPSNSKFQVFEPQSGSILKFELFSIVKLKNLICGSSAFIVEGENTGGDQLALFLRPRIDPGLRLGHLITSTLKTDVFKFSFYKDISYVSWSSDGKIPGKNIRRIEICDPKIYLKSEKTIQNGKITIEIKSENFPIEKTYSANFEKLDSITKLTTIKRIPLTTELTDLEELAKIEGPFYKIMAQGATDDLSKVRLGSRLSVSKILEVEKGWSVASYAVKDQIGARTLNLFTKQKSLIQIFKNPATKRSQVELEAICGYLDTTWDKTSTLAYIATSCIQASNSRIYVYKLSINPLTNSKFFSFVKASFPFSSKSTIKLDHITGERYLLIEKNKKGDLVATGLNFAGLGPAKSQKIENLFIKKIFGNFIIN